MEKKNNLSSLSQEDLKVFEKKLDTRALMLVKTHEWWDKRVDILKNKIERYNISKDIDEETTFKLENEKAHLNLKSAWELREKSDLEIKIKELEKCKEKYFYNNLANSLAKKDFAPPASGKS